MIDVAIPQPPDTGDIREDLVQLATHIADLLRAKQFSRVLGFVVAEIPHKPEFRAAALEITHHRRRHLDEIVERGRRAARVAPDLDTDLVLEVLMGALLFRHFFGETSPDRSYVERVADLLVRSAP